MKYQNLGLLLPLLFFFACQEAPRKNTAEVLPMQRSFPKSIEALFNAHGGYDLWSNMNTLSYDIIKEGGSEKQIIDLKDRRERIEGANFTMGFDGTDTWVEADTSYKGNPIFYKNLMFYFYAMPFVIGDDGIVYGETDDLVFDGESYPGIKISYNDGVGVSSKDEYFVHFSSKTNEMVWLGYTVTYFSNEKSAKIGWIKYDDWKTFNGLKLPQSISWFKTENNFPTEFRNKVEFDNILIEKKRIEDKIFAKTKSAIIAE
jgi:hypothetical protein